MRWQVCLPKRVWPEVLPLLYGVVPPESQLMRWSLNAGRLPMTGWQRQAVTRRLAAVLMK